MKWLQISDYVVFVQQFTVDLVWQGSSMGQFFKQYLEPIKLNDVQVITNFSSIFFCL